jgi:hypothetical protein
MEETYAWLITTAAGLGVMLGILVLTSFIVTGWVRWMVRATAAVWLLLPWPVQVVEGYYAPAVIVALFEGLFNRHGNPWPPLVALAALTAIILVVSMVAGMWPGRRHAE